MVHTPRVLNLTRLCTTPRRIHAPCLRSHPSKIRINLYHDMPLMSNASYRKHHPPVNLTPSALERTSIYHTPRHRLRQLRSLKVAIGLRSRVSGPRSQVPGVGCRVCRCQVSGTGDGRQGTPIPWNGDIAWPNGHPRCPTGCLAVMISVLSSVAGHRSKGYIAFRAISVDSVSPW